MGNVRRGDSESGDARLIEMCSRIFPRLTPIYVAIGFLMLISTPFFGWWVVIPVGVDAAKSAIAHRIASNGYRPELVYVSDQYTSVVLIAAAIYFAGGVTSPFFPFLATFAGLFPVLFTKRHVRRSFGLLLISTVIAAYGPAKPIAYELFFRLGTILCVMFALRVFATELMSSDLRYRAASRVDELTGLANRRAFDAELEVVGQRLITQPRSAALVVGDIDYFKTVNDEHGHAIGDLVLRDVARELSAAFRVDDVAYRIGGEEFAFILVGVDATLAERMASSLRDRITVSYPAGLDVSMSFGVALQIPGETNRTWFRRADAALFAAKRGGRNRVEMATTAV